MATYDEGTMSKESITIEDLAGMVKHGFDGVGKQIDGVEKRVESMEKRVEKGFAEVNERLDRIEKIALADHKRRIERLEADVRYLKDVFAIK